MNMIKTDKFRPKKRRFVVLLIVLSFAGLSIMTQAFSSSNVPIILGSLAMLILLLFLLEHFRYLDSLIRTQNSTNMRQVQSLISIHNTLDLRAPLPAIGDYSIHPDFAELILDTILRNRPEHILELGSGTSTIVCGYALEHLSKGSLTSVDHDNNYAQVTGEEIKRHKIEGSVRVQHAPLKVIELEGHKYRWYDPDCLGQPLPIDLLIVDGPPARSGKFARYPALPMLYNRMSKGVHYPG